MHGDKIIYEAIYLLSWLLKLSSLKVSSSVYHVKAFFYAKCLLFSLSTFIYSFIRECYDAACLHFFYCLSSTRCFGIYNKPSVDITVCVCMCSRVDNSFSSYFSRTRYSVCWVKVKQTMLSDTVSNDYNSLPRAEMKATVTPRLNAPFPVDLASTI